MLFYHVNDQAVLIYGVVVVHYMSLSQSLAVWSLVRVNQFTVHTHGGADATSCSKIATVTRS